jgi:hypothetical protein
LLVRPDGIMGYYLAREAMASWGSEFGYELVDADWTLDFPLPPQPKLKEMEEKAVAEARQRFEWLAHASPERFAQRPKTQYRLSAGRGGLVRDGGMTLGNDPFEGDPLGGFGLPPGRGNSGDIRGDRYGLSAVKDRYGIGNGVGSGDPSSHDTGTGSGRYPAADGSGEHFGGTHGKTARGALAGGNRETPFSAGGANNPSLNGTGPIHETVGSRYSGTMSGGTWSGEQPGNNNASILEPNSSSKVPGGYASASGGNPGAAGSETSDANFGSTTPSSGSSGAPSSPSMGMPSPTLEMNAHQPTGRTANRSVADSRGRNWALPRDSNLSVPITRPIRLECWPDRIVVMSDSRDYQPQVIRLESYTEDSIDQLVAAVREHTRQWGIAGSGMYWKPQLLLKVNPNGEGRAQDLQTLLTNSGLDVKRK